MKLELIFRLDIQGHSNNQKHKMPNFKERYEKLMYKVVLTPFVNHLSIQGWIA